jgi:hypothetical protein
VPFKAGPGEDDKVQKFLDLQTQSAREILASGQEKAKTIPALQSISGVTPPQVGGATFSAPGLGFGIQPGAALAAFNFQKKQDQTGFESAAGFANSIAPGIGDIVTAAALSDLTFTPGTFGPLKKQAKKNQFEQSRAIVGQVLAAVSVFQAGQQSGNPLLGGLSGAITGSAFGPIGATIGGAVGLIGGLFGKKKKKSEPKSFPTLPQTEDVLFASKRFPSRSLEGGREGLPIQQNQNNNVNRSVNVGTINVTVVTPDSKAAAKSIATNLKRELGVGVR